METNDLNSPLNTPDKDAPVKLRVGRIEIGINLLVQIIVLLGMLIMVNYVSSKYYKRWNWARNSQTELSDMTRSLLGNLQKPMQAIVFFSQPGEAEQDAREMLREYEFASKGKLTVEDVNPELNFARARELQAKYKFGAIENVIILDYDGRSKFINSATLAEMEQRDQMEEIQARMQGKALPPPQMISFKGEQVLTNEILSLAESKQSKLYAVNGHGEFDTNSKKLDLGPEVRLQ
jgi:ABC-2 type transport system permease protein